MSIWRNDDDLLASLREALREADAVPSRFVELGKAAYRPPPSLEIDITAGAVLGRLRPAQSGTVTAYPASGAVVTTPVDETGSFAVRPVPAMPFRLRCVTASGRVVSTVIRESAPPHR
ncbi:MAG TPA: hypothetical protein VH502_01020 [Actinoplanes sp.]